MRKVTCMVLVISIGCGLTGCGEVDDDAEEERLGVAQLAAGPLPDTNGLDSYKVIHAPIFVDQTVSQQFLSNPLRTGNLTSTVISSICNDGTSAESLKYIVKCALGPSSSVSVTCNGTTTTYSGLVGLASSWGNTGGSCNTADCKEWVSACVLAHSNFRGQPGVNLQLEGPHAALTTAHASTYVNDESAFWGNLFNNLGTGQARNGCAGTNANVASGTFKLLDRPCGDYSARQGCMVCDNVYSNDPSGVCDGSVPANAKTNYLQNLSSNKLQACTGLCSTGAGLNSGYFSGCSGSSRVITVWRQ